VIGLDTSIERYEYPLHATLGSGLGRVEIRHVGVENQSRRFQQGKAKPDVVICLGCAGSAEKWERYISAGGMATRFGDVVVFGKDLPLGPEEHGYKTLTEFRSFSETARLLKRFKREGDLWVGPVLMDEIHLVAPGRALLLRGFVYPDVLQHPLALDISVDNNAVGHVAATKEEVDRICRSLGLSSATGDGSKGYSFFVQIPLAIQPGAHLLEVRANAWFTGQEKYKNGDLRRLSYRLWDWKVVDQLPRAFMRFTDGWYAYEGDQSGWRRWSGRRGEIELNFAEAEDVILSGSFATVVAGNKVRIALNGTPVGQAVLNERNQPIPMPELKVRMQKGRNLLTFDGSDHGFARDDPRELSFSVSNLTIRKAADGQEVCYLVE